MALTRPLVLPVWADTGDKTAPSNPEVEVGWPVTTIPPSRQRFNWFFNTVHNGVRYLTRRGLADWSADEDYKVGDRCLAADGMTYRCLADHTNIVPGTDPTKWERWGYAKSELDAYLRSALLSPVRCPVTGPAAVPSAASPYTMWQSVAPYNEYWMWTGDAWKVVANRYITSVGTASSTLTANVLKNIVTVTAPRNGSAYLRAILSHANSANTLTVMSGYIRRTRAGVTTDVQDTMTIHHTTLGTQYSQCRPMAPVTVEAGDVYTLVAIASQNMDPAPTNASTIYLEYLQ